MKISIREFNITDWTSVSRIYAEGLATGIATFEIEVPSFEIWDKKFIQKNRFVALINDVVVGFAVMSNTSNRNVYRGVAEVTLYIAENERGKGIGEKLLNQLISHSKKNGYWTLQAAIFIENKASTALFKKCGFRVVGIREKIGMRLGIWYDNYLLERRSNNI